MKNGKWLKYREQTPEKQREMRKSLYAIGAFLLASLVLALLVGKPLLQFIGEPAKFREWVDGHGIWGPIVFIGIMFAQIVIAWLPGEPLELAAGYAFGFWKGTILCMLGAALASTLVFFFVRRFGMRLVRVFFSDDDIRSIRFLQDEKRLTLVALILFLIPGTPKDVMTYFVGLTGMKYPTWVSIATFARIPSIITSTLSGNALGVANYKTAILVFSITAVISLGGLLAYRQFSKKREMPPSQADGS